MSVSGKLKLNPLVMVMIVICGLAALPFAVWLDLRNLSNKALHAQASNLDSIISDIRSYYSENVVKRIQQKPSSSQALHNYHKIPGAFPIPATLSIELGELISEAKGNVGYRFISDYNFANRVPHSLDKFEIYALKTFRQPDNTQHILTQTSGSIFNRKIRTATPVYMDGSCVNCHNQHPLSPKRDWVIGNVRGIQELMVQQPIATNLFSFKYLLLYFICAGTIAFIFILMQFYQAKRFRQLNKKLAQGNEFLESVSCC